MTSISYKKRPGTSGIRGQLYETKLISLINFRAKHNVNINEFSLATNMDNIGIFDDICLRFKVNTLDKPLAVFIQAKHRENDTLLKNDWATYFDSYSKITEAFKPNNKDLIFKGQYDEIECFFVIYTTARGDSNYKAFESISASSLNDVIGTAQCGHQTVAKNKDLECLYKVIMKEQVTQLAKPIAKLLFDEITDFQIFMTDELVYSYHVILAQSFCDVSDIQPEGYRLAHIRQDFFETKDEILMTFKSSLYKEVINKRRVEDSEFKNLVDLFFNKPTDVTIVSKVIGSVITYKNGKLEFVNNKMVNDDLKRKLSKIHFPEVILDNAIEIAGREILTLKQNFKVPTAFGNKDLIIRKGKDERLTYLTSEIVSLIGKSNHNNVITIDESVDKGFLKLNGGIASAVGNLLVYDANSKMLKFNENFQELGDVSRRLLTKLKENKTINLKEFRIDVKIKTFPRLTFECGDHDKNMAKDFFNRLLFYTNQADENETGKILREEIEKHQSDQVSKNSFLSHLIYLKYHDDIQNWWMSPNKGLYLTQESEMFKNAMKTVVSEPPMTIMNKMYEIKTEEANLSFNYEVMKSLELNDQPGYIFITESILLTLYKVKQYLQSKDHVVIDMKYSSELQQSEYEAFLTELQNTNRDKIIIIVFNNNPKTNKNKWKKIEKLANNIKNKQTIIITDNELLKIVQIIFSKVFNVVNDDKTNLTDLSEDTQHSILQKKILFQGQEIKLRSIVDEISKSFVKGDVLSKLIHNETISIGEGVHKSNYDKVKDMYIGRRVCRNKKRDWPVMRIQTEDDTLIRLKHQLYKTCTTHIKEQNTKSCKNKCHGHQQESLHIDTLHDLDDDVIVLTTKPGMGKSTLFTHLFLQTKKVDPTLWIVRINLFEYSVEFNTWKTNKTVIDITECLKFICLATLGNTHHGVKIALQEINNELSLEYCTGDELMIFQFKMFLHFYNRKNLIFLFDGMDEIWPCYADQVLRLIRILKSYPKCIKHKIWITSRLNETIRTTLEKEFNALYDLENLSWIEQNMFLYMFWTRHEILNHYETQLEDIYEFIDFMSESPDINMFLDKNKSSHRIEMPLLSVYVNFICYLKEELKSGPPRIMNILNVLYDRCFAYITVENDCMTSPIGLYLLANYFLNEIKSNRIRFQKWNLNVNAFTFYDNFVETKLKRNMLKEKSSFDVCSPDTMRIYERNHIHFLEAYKELGAYATFHENLYTIFNKDEVKTIKAMIKLLKFGIEKTGMIYEVINDIPVFIHKSIAEYFAVEFICDILKGGQSFDELQPIFELIFNVFDVKPSVKMMFESKLNVDSDLKAIVERNKKDIDGLLKKNRKNYEGDLHSSTSEPYGRMSSVCCNIFHIDLYIVFVLFLFCIIDVILSHVCLK